MLASIAKGTTYGRRRDARPDIALKKLSVAELRITGSGPSLPVHEEAPVLGAFIGWRMGQILSI